MLLGLIHSKLGDLFEGLHLGELDPVSLFQLFIGIFQLFLELFVLFLKGIVLSVKVFFLLLDTSFLSGKLVSAFLDLFFKLSTALVYFVLCFDKSNFLFAVGFFLGCLNDALGFLFGRADSRFSL